ncbi:MAG: KAP family NTPase [Prevotella sp.]|jgi:hypothetical protein|nr:KAP family NTPase [Prevotella sp.]MCI2125842.1 KAP family NTPase [Prevotella sp.]
MNKRLKLIIRKFHINEQVKNFDYWLKVLAWYLGITVSYLLITAVLPDILESKYFARHIAPAMAYVINLLNNNGRLNGFVIITYTTFAVFLIKRVWQNQYLSFITILLCLFIYRLLALSCWDYPKLPLIYNHTYLVLYNVTIIAVILSELKKVIIYKKKDKDYKHKGFSNDTSEIPERYNVRGEYATEISCMLNKTDLKESFAIAITGRWGSGKTTFINAMMPKIKEKMQVETFNPWNSSSPNKIINDFFSLLRNAIIPRYSSLKHPLRKYSRLLTAIDLPKTASNIIQRFAEDDDIGQVKNELEQGLMHLRQPIAIFIDDVDRLGIGEIREVLKLIRNTAKFPNILYVVTMDKEYVAQQLGLVGIDGNLYLEKIFQLEISLPKMDDTEVLMTMRNELLAMTMSHKSVNDLFDDLPQETKGMVLSVVPTFRSAKRFARQFSTIFNFIRDTIGLREIDLFDLFYLELIHYFDRNTYFIMSTDIDKICKIEIDRQHNVLIYKIREGVIKSQIRTNDPLIKNKKTCFFLERIFVNKEFNGNSLQILENYFKYFGYNTPLNRISDAEFDDFLKAPDFNKKKIINSWCFNVKRPILSQSVFAHFIGYKINKNTPENEIASFFNGAFIWLNTEYRNIQEIYFLLPMILIKNRYPVKYRDKVVDYLKSDIRDFAQGDNYLTIIKALFHLIWTDNDISPYIIDNDTIKTAIKDNINRLLKYHHYDNVILIQEDGNIINEIAEYFVANGNSEKQTSVALDILIEALSHNVKSQNKDRVESTFSHVLKNDENPKEENDLYSRLFGGKGMELLHKYLDTCFTEPKRGIKDKENIKQPEDD